MLEGVLTNQFISRLTFGSIKKCGERYIRRDRGRSRNRLYGLQKPIATATATPIPIPMIATQNEHALRPDPHFLIKCPTYL